ncbi:MAG: carboxymuconolactone decarboxylase family protein [Rhodospirillaceae bacterium]|jgi:4-carboxymuconolactone decarboxylase|nr:carboxymuconolactone decarboxylase family protein [Rhodospirillaceae bacterium]MBT4486004.1 carboxymuconolactone decarboxylase family protein [Rhodospirillaceae bacterium]MBT5193826.1 carboxymuconolactone decarboxylase family protein [Rhodospirillaceae bacterium]MBT5897381.1 carboxymuconolactone decarboxylase family protein [Rhodospirillaceae bacterium]MBT6427346.1 carboxymuconolactone decarboxylase family protein [Rhodospirillaceae bacterium]
MPRIPTIEPSAMNDQQRRFYDNIVAGPRGGMGGPFQAWIHSPDFADRAQNVGEYCRFNSVLEPRLSELAILVTARKWTAQFEWFAHEPIALKGGLSAGIIADIKERRTPTFEAPDEAAVYAFAMELHYDNKITDATYAEATARLGDQGVVDLVGVLGYYVLVAMTLNAFEMPLPDGVPLPLAP